MCPMSDREAKHGFEHIDHHEVLRRVASLPITTWSYRQEDPSVRHMGPMAQDFRATFGLGPSDRHISPVDGDGVALAAIQALHEDVRALQDENRTLRADLERMRMDLETRACTDP